MVDVNVTTSTNSVAVDNSTGVKVFTGLTDTPSTLTALKFLRINSDGDAIEELNYRKTATLTDSDTIAHDIDSYLETYVSLSTAESTIALTLSNVIANAIIDYTIQKTISGDCVITFDGTGLRFVDYDNKALPATSLAITLSGTINFHFTISCKVSGMTYSSDKVIMVQML